MLKCKHNSYRKHIYYWGVFLYFSMGIDVNTAMQFRPFRINSSCLLLIEKQTASIR